MHTHRDWFFEEIIFTPLPGTGKAGPAALDPLVSQSQTPIHEYE
jgi:hypothetical protein